MAIGGGGGGATIGSSSTDCETKSFKALVFFAHEGLGIPKLAENADSKSFGEQVLKKLKEIQTTFGTSLKYVYVYILAFLRFLFVLARQTRQSKIHKQFWNFGSHTRNTF